MCSTTNSLPFLHIVTLSNRSFDFIVCNKKLRNYRFYPCCTFVTTKKIDCACLGSIKCVYCIKQFRNIRGCAPVLGTISNKILNNSVHCTPFPWKHRSDQRRAWWVHACKKQEHILLVFYLKSKLWYAR